MSNHPMASGLSKLTRSTKRVSFAEFSTMHVYFDDPVSRCWMTYSSAEYQAFRARTAFEVYQLQRLIDTRSSQDANTIRLLIRQGVIAPEHFLGIENLISECGRERVMYERRVHAALLLKRQKELRERHELNADLLAEVSIARSARSTERARLRADMTSDTLLQNLFFIGIPFHPF